MTGIQKYSDAIEGSIKNDELSKVNTDLAEAILDSTLQDGILKDVPFLGTIIGLVKAGAGIKEQLFVKKIISFLTQLGDISREKRQKMIDEIDNSGKHKIKVGEKLLYIIDKSEDYEKTQLVAKMFKAFIEEKIDYNDFLKSAKIIDDIHLDDLKWFLENTYENLDIDDGAGVYVATGLFEMEQISLRLRQVEGGTYGNTAGEHEIEGGKLKARISYIGKNIRKILTS